MLHRDFKIIFFACLVALFGLGSFVSFLSIGYEDGTDFSLFGKSFYKIAEIIHFSMNFWESFLNSYIALFASFLTTNFILTTFIWMVRKVFFVIKRKMENHEN
jgi:ABC-type Fe3+ transport system permease subunit